MSFLRELFCLHHWIDFDHWNIHRNVDNAVVGIATRQRCDKCGAVRMQRAKF